MFEFFASAEFPVVIGSLAAILSFGVLFFPRIPRFLRKLKKIEVQQSAQILPRETAGHDVAYFINVQKALKAELEAELTTAHEDEKQTLRARITELESQIQNPDAALEAAQRQVADLETRLARMGNEIGGDRLEEAREALERFDYSVADEIFAEVETRNEFLVQEIARAAFGRGEVAETEIRWQDATAHYARAAKLSPDWVSVNKASEFAWRSGDYRNALHFSELLVELAKNEEDHATALNNKAILLNALGRLTEAEQLYSQALEIDKATIGEAHPDYATRLNNLAEVLRAQGRYDEAEQLYTQALEIDKTTIGEAHPEYAIHLSNLAGVLIKLDRRAEAGPMYEEALRIFEATLPPDHPNIARVKKHIAAFNAPD